MKYKDKFGNVLNIGDSIVFNSNYNGLTIGKIVKFYNSKKTNSAHSYQTYLPKRVKTDNGSLVNCENVLKIGK